MGKYLNCFLSLYNIFTFLNHLILKRPHKSKQKVQRSIFYHFLVDRKHFCTFWVNRARFVKLLDYSSNSNPKLRHVGIATYNLCTGPLSCKTKLEVDPEVSFPSTLKIVNIGGICSKLQILDSIIEDWTFIFNYVFVVGTLSSVSIPYKKYHVIKTCRIW